MRCCARNDRGRWGGGGRGIDKPAALRAEWFAKRSPPLGSRKLVSVPVECDPLCRRKPARCQDGPSRDTETRQAEASKRAVTALLMKPVAPITRTRTLGAAILNNPSTSGCCFRPREPAHSRALVHCAAEIGESAQVTRKHFEALPFEQSQFVQGAVWETQRTGSRRNRRPTMRRRAL